MSTNNNLKPEQYKKLMWLTILLIFISPLVEPFSLGIGLSLLAIFCFYMGMKLENK